MNLETTGLDLLFIQLKAPFCYHLKHCRGRGELWLFSASMDETVGYRSPGSVRSAVPVLRANANRTTADPHGIPKDGSGSWERNCGHLLDVARPRHASITTGTQKTPKRVDVKGESPVRQRNLQFQVAHRALDEPTATATERDSNRAGWLRTRLWRQDPKLRASRT